ncbi:MAG: hypothetical protein HOF96_06080 [Candidatus Marinimicrobia bacterium]|nr:hypothetical protein [Candidatus Neomarinimicrobiota bacterium]MBT3631542.1 hypothetical protein [Candidatus Neomarinimicrobiota bacterium]MBT3824529.1 hypothetical protein [Candidatus Neomarinimicrobiota bacterium]MBT4131325.1 hypothetical protein [Candidatus Neomarinimicrobiota bacterium]MBT4418936.1 hypothetical protein [Candidatus Neomarinimicrobiota bacterium]
MEKFLDFIVRAGSLDRRIIFVVIALVVILPLFFPLGLPIRPTNSSQDVYNAVEELEAGDKALVSFEYGPSTKPEIHPMAIALLRHLFEKDVKVYITCLWPDGQFMAMEALEQVADNQYNKVYGEDYVLLGYRPGAEAVIKGLVSNIRKVFTVDSQGNFLDDIPMMVGVNQVKDFDYLFSASAGYPGTVEWVQYAADPTGVTMSTGTTSIQVNEVMPYVQSGQIVGILGGMPGAAEYESLIGQAGIGTSGMDAQSVAHLVIVGFIIFGNISFFVERRRSKKY